MLKTAYYFLLSHLCWLLLFISVIHSAATDPVPVNCEGDASACQVPSSVPLDTYRYIVMMHPQKSAAGTLSNRNMVSGIMSTISTSSILDEFDFGATWGFRATLTPEQAAQLQSQSSVKAVVKERIVSLDPIVPASSGTLDSFPRILGSAPQYPGVPQSATLQFGLSQPNLLQPRSPQSGLPQAGFQQPNLLQPRFPRPISPQPRFPQPRFPQPSFPQPGLPQPSTPQPSFPQPSFPQPSFPQPSFPQPSFPQPSFPQPSFPQPSFPQPSFPQPSFPQPSFPQPSFPQPSFPQPSFPQPSFPQPISPQPISPQPSIPDVVPAYLDCPAPNTLPVCPAPSNFSTPLPAFHNDSLLRHRSNCWGLSRIYSNDTRTACDYIYPATAGEGVLAYIIDTGINAQHQEFLGADGKSRAIFLDDFTTSYAIDYPGVFLADNQSFVDTNGHGTHVAGTLGGRSCGVANKVTLIAVRVMNRQGLGTNTGILKGLARAYSHWRAQGKPPAVVNLSISIPKQEPSFLTAIETMMADGMHVVLAAGNDNADNSADISGSPEDDPASVIVAACDKNMEIASFSNYGQYVSLFAPGVDIFSAWIGGTSMYHTISGTSMASPHAAGTAALYLSNLVKEGKPAPTTAQLKQMIVDDSQKNVITFTYNDFTGTKAKTTANKFLSTLRLVCSYL